MIRAKKSLGQNFLVDRNILEKIANVVQIKDKTILEVGPGKGGLVNLYEKFTNNITLIEPDNKLFQY